MPSTRMKRSYRATNRARNTSEIYTLEVRVYTVGNPIWETLPMLAREVFYLRNLRARDRLVRILTDKFGDKMLYRMNSSKLITEKDILGIVKDMDS